jgi:drug/metabolite transporter (DMT)-like permease
VLVTLGASIMWALEPVLAKLSYRSTDYLNTFATRILFSLVVIVIYLIITKKRIAVARTYIPKLIYISLAATLFADLMYIYALTRVPVVNAVLIGHMQPVFVIIIGTFMLTRERLTRYDYTGIAFMLVAGFLVTTKTVANLVMLKFGTTGDLYVLFATVAWATTAIVARRYLRTLPAVIIAFYRFLFAGVVFLTYQLLTRGIEIVSIHQILIGFVIGIGTILYYEGIRLIKAAQVAALELSTPFFATLLGFLVLQEYITVMQGAGILCLFGGIYCLARKENVPS